MNKRMREKKRLEREVAALRTKIGGLLGWVTLLEEAEKAQLERIANLSDRLATFEKINEDNVVVANEKFVALEKECQELRKELNRIYLQKKPWWKR